MVTREICSVYSPCDRLSCSGVLLRSTLCPDFDPSVAATPLLFHDRLALEERDPQVLGSRLDQHYTLLDFGPRPGFERAFRHRFVTAVVGELTLTCGYTSPIHGTIGETPGVGLINFCSVGSSIYTLEGQDLHLKIGRAHV